MKNVITILFCFPCLLFAQNIPNAGFEIWQIGGVIQEADNWRTSNTATLNQFGVYSAAPDSENFTEGFTSLRLTTFYQDTLGAFAAFIVSGSPEMDYGTGELNVITGGTPFPHRPSKMIGQYQFESQSLIEDFGQARVILKKYNSATGQADTIGYGENVLLNPTVGFQNFEVPIQYSVPDVIPDSVIVVFYSTHPMAPTAGGELWVDDLSFEITTDVSEFEEISTFKMFPNPFQSFIKIEIENAENGLLELISFDGKVVFSKDLPKGFQSFEIPTASLPSGNYFLSWKSEKGENSILKQGIKIN